MSYYMMRFETLTLQMQMSPIRLVLERVIGSEGGVSNSISVVNHNQECYLENKVSNITSDEVVQLIKEISKAGEIKSGDVLQIPLLAATCSRASLHATVHVEFKFPRNTGTINIPVVERKDKHVIDIFRSLSKTMDVFFNKGLCEETSECARKYGILTHTLATFTAFEKHPSY